jgi:hypothetical protein
MRISSWLKPNSAVLLILKAGVKEDLRHKANNPVLKYSSKQRKVGLKNGFGKLFLITPPN